MTPVLDLNAVGVRLGPGGEQLAGVDLHLLPGAVAGIAGPAGTGKTLLAEVAALARVADRGRRRLFGAVADRPERAAAAALRRRIGWATAEPVWVDGLDAAGNAALPLRIGGVAAEPARARATELLGWLEVDPRARAAPPAVRRRVELARALVAAPELVVVDALDGCDPALLALLATLVGRLGRQGAAFLLLARDARLLDRVGATQLWRLHAGRLEAR